ncbi:hypothetical protein V8G54_036745 [Vigna mungo]|uniref:Retroviral polymerase SH3-like domain-containing protein n=1 Tax=Vigna mungo TaxID=3915 RepID=A0AAQ3MHB9_VIGMU
MNQIACSIQLWTTKHNVYTGHVQEFPVALKFHKVFGCLCFTHVPHNKCDKLDRRVSLGIFIGYSNDEELNLDNSEKKGLTMAKLKLKFSSSSIEEENDWQNQKVDDAPVRGREKELSMIENLDPNGYIPQDRKKRARRFSVKVNRGCSGFVVPFFTDPGAESVTSDLPDQSHASQRNEKLDCVSL